MKYLNKILILILSFWFFQCSLAFAQNNYSSDAINIYNSGLTFHKQGNYESAEQKYNQALKLQPDFWEAKNNLAVLYRTKARNYYAKEDYDNAILYAQKALPFSSQKLESYNLIANSYNQLNNYGKAIPVYRQILEITPDDDLTMNSLASAYIKTNEPEKAQELFEKILVLYPNDKIAQQNLRYVKHQKINQKLSQSLDNLTVKEHAPLKIYKLIKPDYGISDKSVEDMKMVLDIVWSEPSGKILLKKLAQKKITIKILNQDTKATTEQHLQKIGYCGIGIDDVKFYTISTTTVNIPVQYIENFKNPNLPAYKRVYNLQVFVHEFGHAFMFANNKENKDSIEEEVGVSMVGYNLANKVITGEYLDREESKNYAISCLEGALSDEHKDLPVSSGFNNAIKAYGIDLPYPEEYSDLTVIYKQLLSEGRIIPVKNFSFCSKK